MALLIRFPVTAAKSTSMRLEDHLDLLFFFLSKTFTFMVKEIIKFWNYVNVALSGTILSSVDKRLFPNLNYKRVMACEKNVQCFHLIWFQLKALITEKTFLEDVSHCKIKLCQSLECTQSVVNLLTMIQAFTQSFLVFLLCQQYHFVFVCCPWISNPMLHAPNALDPVM